MISPTCALHSKQNFARTMGSHARLPNIDISAVLLPGELRAKLVKGGFKMTADFSGMSPSELAKETQMSQKDAVEVLRAIRGDARPAQKGGKSALELLQVPKISFKARCRLLLAPRTKRALRRNGQQGRARRLCVVLGFVQRLPSSVFSL